MSSLYRSLRAIGLPSHSTRSPAAASRSRIRSICAVYSARHSSPRKRSVARPSRMSMRSLAPNITTAISAFSRAAKVSTGASHSLLVMHQRGAGMGAVEHAKARVLGQHALQAAREAGRLAVAEHDDSRRALLVLRRGLPLALCLALGMRVRPRKPEEHDKQPGAPGSARAAKTANPPLHGVVPLCQGPPSPNRIVAFRPGACNRVAAMPPDLLCWSARQLLTACRGVRRPLQAEAGERGREGEMSARSTGRTGPGTARAAERRCCSRPPRF